MINAPSLQCSQLLTGLELNSAKAEIVSDKDDAALVRRTRAGDLSAFKELVERYQSRAHAIAFGIIGNHSDAEDIAQDAFLKAYRNLSNFRGQSSFYTWLYRIIFNLAIDLRRKRYRHMESSVGDTSEVDHSLLSASSAAQNMFGSVPTTEQEFERKELRSVLTDALSDLSPDHRMVIMLREIDGMSYTEISDVVGCSKGTVMSRLHHARKRLQKALAEFRPAARNLESNDESNFDKNGDFEDEESEGHSREGNKI